MRLAVLRNPWTSAFALTAGVGASIFLLAVIIQVGSPEDRNQQESQVFVLLVASAFCWMVLKIGWLANVEVRSDRLIVRQFFVRLEVVPEDVVQVRPLGGLPVVLRDGRELGCFAFSDSLLGVIAGYPSARRAVARIEGAYAGRFARQVEEEGEPVVVRRGVQLHVWVFVGFLVVFAAVLSVFGAFPPVIE